jgi:holliday junction DNA helicase RuvA
MIAQLTGTLLRIEGTSNVIVDVSGVGYQVTVPGTVASSLPDPGASITLLTHMVGRVQPDFEMTLYGFSSSQQLGVFRMLINVQGVGARVAIAMLSTMDSDELARAVATNDTKTLTRVPGVGPKLAQRLCLELGDSMASLAFEQRTARAEAGKKTAVENASYEDVIEALVGLGYSRADSRKAADSVFANAADKTNTSALISAGLQLLASPKK